MKQTNNLGLALYESTDKMNITGEENSLNHNMELIETAVSGKQATLVSGTNIKTINGQSILGNGNMKIETSTEDKVPAYVTSEADAVIEKVMAAQGNRTFTFAAISDMHYGREGYLDGYNHAIYALKYIDSQIGLDAIAVLGDYTDYRPTEGIDLVLADFRAVNKSLKDMRHIPNLRMHGNHDYWDGHAPEVFRYTGSLSDGEVWGHATDGYYYRDFDRVKLRVIVLNLVGDETGNVRDSAGQAQWFADSLDLSGKLDAASWQILVLSHQSVDFWRVDDTPDYILPNIIDAYVQGTSYSSGTVSCNFAGKNGAKFIGNIHGHLHNLLVDKIYSGECSVSSQINALRICTPEAVYGRTGENESVWEAATNYPKVKNSSWDTSFVIYCIDLSAKTINAVCYGAGCHRIIDYDALTYTTEEKDIIDGGDEPDTPAAYTNWIPIATDDSGNTVTNGMMYSGKRWTFGENELVDATGHWITGFIPAKVGDMIRVRWDNYYTQSSGYISIHAFDASKQRLATGFSFNQMNTPEWEGLDFQNAPGYSFDYENGIVDFTIPECGYTPAETAYIVFCLAGSSSDAIVTVNEAIE